MRVGIRGLAGAGREGHQRGEEEGTADGSGEAALAAEAPAVRPARASPARSRRRLVQAALVLSGLGAACLLAWLAPGGRAAGPIRAVAVMPVENLTGDPDHDHLAAELGELIVNDLARERGLQVVSRGEARRFGGTTLSSRAIGRELAVDGLLEAAIVRHDDRLRVTAELVDTRTERLVWAEVFETTPEDLLELQALLSAAVLEAVGLATPAPASPAAPAVASPVEAAGPPEAATAAR